MNWTRVGSFLAIPASLVAIVAGVYAFGDNFVTKPQFNSQLQKVEIQLAGALKDFRQDFNAEREKRRERDFRIEAEQLKSQEEFYEDKLRQLEQQPPKDDYQKKYFERQLQRTREQHERVQDAIIEIQKMK
jgi:hypothetical protein